MNHPKAQKAYFNHYFFQGNLELKLITLKCGIRYLAWKGNYSHLNSTPNWFKKLYLNAQKEIWNQDKIKNTYRTLSEDETRALVCLTSLLVMLETGKEKEHQELNLNCPSICSVDKEYSEKVNDYLENYFGFSLIEWSRKENEKND